MKPKIRSVSSSRLLRIAVALCVAAITTYSLLNTGSAKVVHTEPSAFSPIVIYEERGERCMNFGSVDAVGRQTCIDLESPDRMVFGYTRMMMSALFVKPDPENVLIIGLGGGTLSSALGQVLPDAVIDTVEIDPAVVQVASEHFGYRQSDRQRVFLEDGRAFIERTHREGRRYDMVMLDAFDVNYIPPHLLTQEFLQHVRAILEPDGVLVANTFSESTLYHQESATYASVFGDFFNLREGNRVIIASAGALPDAAQLEHNAQTLAEKLAPFGIEVERQLGLFSRDKDWDQDAAVLVDQK